jgi:peptidoglycan-associated lipoprotein
MKLSRQVILVAVMVFSMVSAGCAKKKVATQTTPPTLPRDPTTASAPRSVAPARTESTPAAAPSPTRSNYPDAATQAHINELLARIEDAYFDYNKHTLRPDAVAALQKDSTELRDILKGFPEYKLTIEGHCDERGSREYNLALGDARAIAAKDYLSQVGIPAGQLSVISFGKERPACEEHDEACWQKNRRIHIAAAAPAR